MSALIETLKTKLNNQANSQEFDLFAALDEVLSGGLTAADSGGKLTFYGQYPKIPGHEIAGVIDAGP